MEIPLGYNVSNRIEPGSWSRPRMNGINRGLTIRATGRWGLLLVGAIVLPFVLNALFTRDTLPEGGLEAIQRGLATEYRLRRIAGVTLPEGATEDLAEDLRRLEQVTIPSFCAKGWGFSRIVRVEVTVAGETPPDGRVVRYLQLQCGPVIDCVVVAEVSRIKYRLGLWFVAPAVAGFPAVQ